MAKTLDDYLTPDGPHTGWTGPRSFGRKDTAPRVSNRLAQVIQYERTHGPLSPDQGVRESCTYRYCLTPAHLEAVALSDARRGAPRAASGTDDSAALHRKLDRILELLEGYELPAEPEPLYVTELLPDHTYRCTVCDRSMTTDTPIDIMGLPHVCGAIDSIVEVQT